MNNLKRFRYLQLESCESRLLLAADLLTDLNPYNRTTNPGKIANLNDLAIFAADDLNPFDNKNTAAVYRSDGTGAGTQLLREFPGRYITSPSLYAAGSNVFFTTSFGGGEGANGQELWKTDGTVAGTVMVAEFSTMSNQWPDWFQTTDTHVLFRKSGENAGIWSSDGTADGTVRLFEDESNVGRASNIGGTLFFGFNHVASNIGYELWKTDGTIAGTELVKDIAPGSNSSSIDHLQADGDLLYFNANDQVTGDAVWTSDGTADGTQLVVDLDPEGVEERPTEWLLYADGNVFYSKFGSAQVWTTDGTVDGTIQLSDFRDGPNPIASRPLATVGNQLLFFPEGARNQVWISDGTPEGTEQLERVDEGYAWSPEAVKVYQAGLLDYPVYLSTSDSAGAFFYPRSEERFIRQHGELWIDDGAVDSPRPFVEVYPGPREGMEPGMTVVGDLSFFVGSDELNGTELWRTDGSFEGTFLAKNVNGSFSEDSDASFPTKIGDAVYFVGHRGLNDGVRFWVHDENGARLLKIINPSQGQDRGRDPEFTQLGDQVLFLAYENSTGRELYRTDGTDEGTKLVRNIGSGIEETFEELADGQVRFLEFNDELYFTATVSGRTEFWKTDGSSEGTQRVFDLFRNSNARMQDFTLFGDAIYFAADDGENGRQLWRTRGDAETTERITSIEDRSPDVDDLLAIGDKLFFTADLPEVGRRLWVTDGSTEGTRLVKDLGASRRGNSFANFTEFQNKLFFSARTDELGQELWVTDGTDDGTHLVADLNPGRTHSNPNQLIGLGDQLFFLAVGVAANGQEPVSALWTTDGTKRGTRLVKQDQGRGTPGQLTTMGDRLFFLNLEESRKMTLWSSDGTSERTSRIDGFLIDPSSQRLHASGDQLYFTVSDEKTGSEIWVLDTSTFDAPLVTASQHEGVSQLESVSFWFSETVDYNAVHLQVVDEATGIILPIKPTTRVQHQNGISGDRWNFDNVSLPAGDYSIRISGSVTNSDGIQLDGNHDFVGGDDHIYRFTFYQTADANLDRAVDFDDFLILSANFGLDGQSRSTGDFDGDGSVSFADFLLLSGMFGQQLPPFAEDSVEVIPPAEAERIFAASSEANWWQ